MDAVNSFVTVYATLTAVFNTILVLTGESRIDTYIALNILSYFIAYGLFMRETITTTPQKIVNGLLLTIFMLIIAYRVWTVITG